MIAYLLATSGYGTIPEWVAIGIAASVAWRISRGGGGTAVSELSEANRVLEKRLHELGAEVRDLRIENAELRGRTNFSVVMAKHEERAQERADSFLRVLDLIAARLGPDGANGSPSEKE